MTGLERPVPGSQGTAPRTSSRPPLPARAGAEELCRGDVGANLTTGALDSSVSAAPRALAPQVHEAKPEEEPSLRALAVTSERNWPTEGPCWLGRTCVFPASPPTCWRMSSPLPTPAKSLSLSGTYFPSEGRGGGKLLRLGSLLVRFQCYPPWDTAVSGLRGAGESGVPGSSEAESSRPAGISARCGPQSPRAGFFPSR